MIAWVYSFSQTGSQISKPRPMNILADRPNILFNVFVRNEKVGLVQLTKLRRPIYYKRIIAANTIIRIEYSNKVWRVKGVIHREDGPAVVCNQRCMWYKWGVIHRDVKPAIEYDDSYEWYYKGKLHRDGDLPARIINGGDGIKHRCWYKHGKLHRDTVINGDVQPATITTKKGIVTHASWYIDGRPSEFLPKSVVNGKHEWYIYGAIHSVDGIRNQYEKYKAAMAWIEKHEL